MRTIVVIVAGLAPLVAGPACHRASQREPEPPAVGDRVADDLPEWRSGRQSMGMQLGVVPTDYLVRARAASREAADLLLEPVIREGTRVPLPPGVEVDLYLSAVLSGGRICIRNSVSAELDVFRLTIGDETVADLQSGKNVNVTRPGEQWITYTACVPPVRVPKGTPVTLTTHRAGMPPDDGLTAALQF